MKSKYARIALWTLCGLIVVAGIAGLIYYVQVLRPNKRLTELAMSLNRIPPYQDQKVDPSEIRKVCHQILSYRDGNHHDAFIFLDGVGDQTSVPYLIHALRWQPPPQRGLMICTTAHCLTALYHLTGQKFGYDPAAWERWLAQQKRKPASQERSPAH